MITNRTLVLRGSTLFGGDVFHIVDEMIEVVKYPISLRVQMTRGTADNDVGEGSEIGVVVRAKPKTKKPAMYQVIMLNDDYTPMEFVILVLERFFSKSSEEATQIMMHVHQKGVGVCGVFTFEVAEMKVQQVMDLARQHQHPLQCTLEKA